MRPCSDAMSWPTSRAALRRSKVIDLESGALESSTTSDTTAQLVAMIQAQQAYQANAQVLSTDNTLDSDLISAISR